MAWGRGSKDKYPDDWESRRKRVYKRDNHACQECGESKEELHAHHVKPISKGGTHELSNLKTVCKSCHEDIHGHPVGGGGSTTDNNILWIGGLMEELSSDEAPAEADDGGSDDLMFFHGPPRSKGEKHANTIGGLVGGLVFISPALWAVSKVSVLQSPLMAFGMFGIALILFGGFTLVAVPLGIVAGIAANIAAVLSRDILESAYGEREDGYLAYVNSADEPADHFRLECRDCGEDWTFRPMEAGFSEMQDTADRHTEDVDWYMRTSCGTTREVAVFEDGSEMPVPESRCDARP